jgi:hypothetical protein
LANFDEHISQAVKNIKVLSDINKLVPDTWDWQVTIGFYVAVHCANAHIAKTINQHYRSHGDVKNAINFYSQMNPSKFDEDAYLAYVKLQNYSRRARYLCNDNPNDLSERAHHISEKHFAKSLRLLNKVLEYIKETHPNISIPRVSIICDSLKENELSVFFKSAST